MAKFYIRHKTEYTYSDYITESAYKIRLYPIIDDFLKVVKHTIDVSFMPEINCFLDFNNNMVGAFSVVKPHKRFLIESYLEVITTKRDFPENNKNAETQWQNLSSLKYNINYIDYLLVPENIINSEYKTVLQAIKTEGKTPLKVFEDLCSYVNKEFTYTKNITNVDTKINEAWNLKAGVCQDFANVLIFLLKKSGIPAKYVSGYICSNNDGLIGEGATHAWVEAYIPGFGWLGMDPTNNCVVDDKHVRIATGRNYADCAPVDGVYRGTAKNSLDVKVIVNYDDIKAGKEDFIYEKPIEFKKNSFVENQNYIQEQQQQQ